MTRRGSAVRFETLHELTTDLDNLLLVGAPAPFQRTFASLSYEHHGTRYGFQNIPEELQHTLEQQCRVPRTLRQACDLFQPLHGAVGCIGDSLLAHPPTLPAGLPHDDSIV